MNASIVNVFNNTNKTKIKDMIALMLANPNKCFMAIFKKKDGSNRTMKFVPKFEYNEMMGKSTTNIGRKIVHTKSSNDMIVVSEILGEGVFQPRTLNLATCSYLNFV